MAPTDILKIAKKGVDLKFLGDIKRPRFVDTFKWEFRKDSSKQHSLLEKWLHRMTNEDLQEKQREVVNFYLTLTFYPRYLQIDLINVHRLCPVNPVLYFDEV
ncbi:MAG TPA: hypothetical protein GXZ27_05835 [Thermoanaerobacterales bacterium]|jgi:hypothetical protein|nr:hypothetical protein [Thermoanaerobacterales bacterium]